MKKFISVMLAIIFCVSFLTVACSPSTTQSPQSNESNASAASNESSEKTELSVLNVSLEGNPNTLDNQKFAASLEAWATDPINGFLVTYDENLNLQPFLAESWEFVSETEIKFKLRNNAFFHNGRQVVAEDVKFSIERVKDPETGSRFRTNMDVINSIEVLGQYEFTLKLQYPYGPVLDSLTNIAIIPKEAVATLDTAPVGCGPFKFIEWKRDQSLELAKFDKYWRTGYPKVDSLVFKFLPEYNSARSAFLAKDLDILLWLNNNDVKSMEANKNVYAVGKELLGMYYLGFNCITKPFDNPKVRQAMALAIDRQACLNSALGGYGAVAFSFIDSKNFYFNNDWKYERNIEQAKKLLTEAGYPNGFDAKVTVPQTPVEGPLGELLQSQMNDIGIKLEVEKLEVPTYIDRIFTKKDYSLMVCGDTGSGDPDYPTYDYLVTGGKNAIFNYSNSTYDDLMQKGRASYDKNERKKFYDQAFSIIITQDYPQIMMVQEKRYSVLQKYVKGFIFKPNLKYDFSEVVIEK